MIHVSVLLIAAVHASGHPTFDEWIVRHGKNFPGSEYARRQEIYKANLDKINEHNAKNASYTQGVNQFTDMTSGNTLFRVLKSNHSRGICLEIQTDEAASGRAIQWHASQSML